jgi:hypothetical protein
MHTAVLGRGIRRSGRRGRRIVGNFSPVEPEVVGGVGMRLRPELVTEEDTDKKNGEDE